MAGSRVLFTRFVERKWRYSSIDWERTLIDKHLLQYIVGRAAPGTWTAPYRYYESMERRGTAGMVGRTCRVLLCALCVYLDSR